MTEIEKHAFDMAVLADSIVSAISSGRDMAGQVVASAVIITASQMPTDTELKSDDWDIESNRDLLIGELAHDYVRAQFGNGTWPPTWWKLVTDKKGEPLGGGE
jgi:hypothetical protein